MTEPKEAAVVAREHRVAALKAFGWEDVIGTKNQLAAWVEGGNGRDCFSEVLPTTAQAIADAEARGRTQASGFDEQVAADLETLRYFVNAPPLGEQAQVKAWQAIDRIENRLRGER